VSERNLNNDTYLKIKQMMLNYEITPGQRLTFTDLAERLGVSRTPVNNALSLLAKEGFLDFTPNQGYTVHTITKDEADQLYEIRILLEMGALEKAVANRSPANLKELARREKAFKQAVEEKQTRGRFQLDQEFHAYIVEMSGNHYLAEYFREVYQRIFLRHRISPLKGERIVEVPTEHHELVEAISSGNLDLAKDVVRRHIEHGRDYIYSFIFD